MKSRLYKNYKKKDNSVFSHVVESLYVQRSYYVFFFSIFY